MDSVFLPEAIMGFPRLSCEDVHFIYYRQKDDHPKNRVVFHCHAISLVLKGTKEVYHFAQKTVIHAHEATLIPEGNSLIAERTCGNDAYTSLVVLFPASRVLGLIGRMGEKIPASAGAQPSSLKFHQNAYLKAYVQNLCDLVQRQVAVSPRMVLHKLEELLLVLIEQYPAAFFSVFKRPAADQGASLRNIVENNLMENLSLEELAFLAHQSLSSFKRSFEKAYGMPPGRYIRERKLEMASGELLQGKTPSDLYLRYGYESVSNFMQAFKKKYGMTPARFQSAG